MMYLGLEEQDGLHMGGCPDNFRHLGTIIISNDLVTVEIRLGLYPLLFSTAN